MDLHFFEPEELPRERGELRMLDTGVAVYPDSRRVKVGVRLPVFTDRPNLDVLLIHPDGRAVATFSVVEMMDREMTFTLHLRDAPPAPGYIARFILFYAPTLEARQADPDAPDEIVHSVDLAFDVPEPAEAPEMWDELPDEDQADAAE